MAAKEKNGYYTAYRSVFDKGPLQFTYFPRNEAMADTIVNQRDLQLLKDFAQGYYTFDRWGDTTVINVLRFGQEVGWYNPKERFAFHYYLTDPNDNDLVVQRGRFEHWDSESLKAFFTNKKGLCSHYASATALILRAKGIPSRLVSGFMGT